MTNEEEVTTSAAATLLANLAALADEKKALIERLHAQRKEIDEALVALGAKRIRKPKAEQPKRGRPRKVRTEEVPA